MIPNLVGAAVVSVMVLAGRAAPAAGQPGRPAGPPAKTSCETCHERLGGPAAAVVAAFREDVHRARGFTCVDCHGGNPATDDITLAEDPARGFRGVPEGAAVIATCARCHSDAELMRRFAPRQRVDQASEYAASVHGQQLARGDRRVATCTSCHGAHGIRLVSDAKAPVFPLNVSATCARCHADPEHMKGYTGPDGSPLPTDQRATYEKSVHYAALTKGNDLSAPTCNDCHGNHGAAPPGVGTVANVCGTCHAAFAERFDRSTHRQVFDRGCAECHGNHLVEKTSDEMVGGRPPSVCVGCHGEGDNGFRAAETMRGSLERLKTTAAGAEALIARVKNAGMEVSDQELALAEARTRLTVARTEMHSGDPLSVDRVVEEGVKIVAGVDRAGQAALAELRFRRGGLAVSLGAILLLVVALGLKIREIDRRQRLKS